MESVKEQKEFSVWFGDNVPQSEKIEEARAALEKLGSGEMEFSGWVGLPADRDIAEMKRIRDAAKRIRAISQILIVVGIGGSYLGAKSVIKALSPNSLIYPVRGCKIASDETKIFFAGCNLSAQYHENILEMIKHYETSICVISKSGTTTEPAAAFEIFKQALVEKYGATEARTRIYAITGGRDSLLAKEAAREGYVTFAVPEDVGGRYSVLSPVGLIPIAVAGIDTEALLDAAEEMRQKYFGSGSADGAGEVLAYAMARHRMATLRKKGGWPKTVEVFEYYEPRLSAFAEWLKQLFGESEGKKGKGIFPASLAFSTDLHSMGQFLQEGRQIFFETLLDVRDSGHDLTVPENAASSLAGKSMNEIERAATEGVIRAHEAAGIPVIRINIPDFSENSIGKMIYFFEVSCAISSMLFGVNPFNQPGVEAYKAEMKAELSKAK